ncbi:exodeoxyribonuclease V subunit beta [Kingella negevensis]|uniref:RecBCD enzyme subunit RecB n=1 Tax=Kingella negevensis TaxID=1522312 RepID=A0A238HG01_9NEIS|nr:exodeoxyribonuclease V subunit beta [Kingella negevensis]MDK4696374.1 exodeoxyribonuclease V subunit beta [Kingella negevensis]SNB63193.1 RecBCD enzyme subunit RecB [Kingella negevensis]
MSNEFHPLKAPISQTNLIEASAGTGKTWNIAALFTRLIVLEKLSVDNVLVVTFTKAATAELKTRLRDRLDEALRVLLQTPNATENPETLLANCHNDPNDFLYQLLQQALEQEPDQTKIQLRLKAAISNFDNAAIYTIHGFCQRILQDFAFYCQVPFSIELDEDNAPNDPTFAQDYWRSQIAHHAQRADLVYHRNVSPQDMAKQLASFVGRPYLQFRQPENAFSLADAQDEFERAWQHTAPQFAALTDAFWALHPQLKYYDEAQYRDKFAKLTQFSGCPRASDLWAMFAIEVSEKDKATGITRKWIENPFSQFLLEKRTRSKQILDETQLNQVLLLGELLQCSLKVATAEDQELIRISHELAHYLREANEQNKKSSPTRQFDDLLLDVFAALQDNREHAQALANAIAQNWRVALIDEFQDTDPLQYNIFQAAFIQSAFRLPEKLRPTLFMVGDPKQAIYSFRGADIFAYLTAAQHAKNLYTLRTNHRSHRKLINSISALFAHPAPFVLPQIDYTPVNASREQNNLPQGNAAVRVSWLNDPDAPKTENSDVLTKRAAQWCADEIAQTLRTAAAGRFRLQTENGEKPLHAGQIAVLVRARKDGARVQQELKKHGVQSVLLSRDSIFGEEEALAIYALLGFFIQPQRVQQLNYVLSGCLFGYTAAQLTELNENEHTMTQWTDAATRAYEEWKINGVFTALQKFLAEHKTEQQLLAQGNDRTLTNLHQIMEILAAEDENGRTPVALYQWLGENIQAAKDGTAAAGNAILRLESDENLVKIVTMHASKGLQYPIVYCPFAWKSSDNNRQKWFIIHHENGSSELLHKDQIQDSDKAQIERERLSEDLRLLYVALTRAEEQLNIYMGSYRDSKHSPFAYLLGCQDTASKPDIYREKWQAFINQQNREETNFAWNAQFQPNPVLGSLKTQTQPENAAPTEYTAAQYAPRKYYFTTHTSFTSLSRQTERAHAAEQNAFDDELLPALDSSEQTPTVETAEPLSGCPNDISAFPQGAAAGVCLHEVLEKYCFAQSPESQAQRIGDVLEKHGFAAETWLPAVEQMIDDTRHTPLLPDLTLHSVSADKLLPEMGFLLHTNNFRLRDLQTWFVEQSGLPENMVQAAKKLSFRDVYGFVSGFIDMLAQSPSGKICVIDYKSNWLGESPDDYTPAVLNQVIAEHHYYLQALIYAIATARYLRSRNMQPETIFVRYLFLRGLNGINDNGVWIWDIPVSSLKKWL